ncbi:MAG: glycosyltransferase family 4 protein [Methanoregula sp.]
MKILRVVSDLYPAVVGGIGIHAHQMSVGQAKMGQDVTVFTLNQNKSPKTEFVDGYKIVRFPSYFSICGNYFAPELIVEILKRKKTFDIIHAHSHLFFSTNVCVFARLLHSAPLIITNHGLISASTPAWLNTLYKNTFSIATFKIADHIICYTGIEKENLEKLGIDPKKISVIHNGVDTTLFAPITSRKISDRKQIVWVGRYVPGKGVEYLIEAFSRVKEKIPQAHLVLVGDGPEKAVVEAKINNLRLQASVTLISYLKNTELPQIYNQSDVFVLPSLMEGVPRTLLEAMACKIPVITTDLPHLLDIVEGAGLVVPSKNASLLANAMITILEGPLNAEAMGQCGREKIVKGYSWEDTVKKTLTLYQTIIECPR